MVRVLTAGTRRLRTAVSVAFRFAAGHRGRAASRVRSAVLGIGLSLVPLVLVLNVAEGMIQGITARYIEAGTGHLRAGSRLVTDPEEFRAVRDRIGEVEGVEHAFLERRGLGLAYPSDEEETAEASGRGGRAGVTLRAVEPELHERDEGFRSFVEVREGVFDLSESHNVVLGAEMARRLHVGVGDEIRILTVRQGGHDRILPRVSRAEVQGIVSTGYQDLDRLWVFLPLERGERIIPDESGETFISVKIEDPLGLPNPLFDGGRGEGRVAETHAAVRAELPGGWNLRTWFELERPQYLSFLSTKNLLSFIMFLIVCVASVNIASSLATLAIEKRDEIAFLKSTGTSSRMVATVFLCAGFLIGTAGTALGVTLGLAATVQVNALLYAIEWVIQAGINAFAVLGAPFGVGGVAEVDLLTAEFYLEEIPIVINPYAVLVAAGLSIALATVAALVPARRASRIRPLEVLRRR